MKTSGGIYEKMPTVDLISELTRLEKDAEIDVIKYNKMIDEIWFRFPFLKEQPEFQKINVNKTEKIK